MSTTTAQGSFQVTTELVSVPQQIVAPYGKNSDESEIVQSGSSLHRIDNLTASPQPHYRAVQLDRFTHWLKNEQSATTAAEEETADSNVADTASGVVGTDKIYRFDTIAQETAVQPVRQPHFDTKYYVDISSTNPFVEPAVQQLKEDGRVVGKLDGDISQANEIRFQWPNVTSQLLGSPAMLNLEINLQRVLKKSRARIVIASSTSGCGATTVTLALARQLAAHDNRVLVVDANLVDSGLAQRIGISNPSSWLRTVSVRRSPMELIVKDCESTVSLLPLAVSDSHYNWPAKTLDMLSSVLDSIAWEFDTILFDVGTAAQFAKQVSHVQGLGDLTLLVSSDESRDYELSLAKSKLLSTGANNLMIVQNFSQANELAQGKVG